MGTFRRVVGLVAALSVWAALGLSSFSASPARGDALVVDDPVGVAQLLVLANVERAAAGLPPLALRDDVTAIAAEQSRRMAQAGDISHNDAYFTAEVRQRLAAKTLGENVAMNPSIDDAHRRLMNSPGHRANLMNAKFTVVGMGVARTVDGMAYVTQDFVEPTGALRPLPVPVPVPAPAPDPAPEAPPAAPAPPKATPHPAPPAPPAPSPAPARIAPAPPAATTPAPAAAAVEAAPAATPDTIAPVAIESSTTTTPLEVVSVVTAPISSSVPPSAPPHHVPVPAIAAAFGLLVAAVTAAVRTHRKDTPDSAV
jgi:hypothetical protein